MRTATEERAASDVALYSAAEAARILRVSPSTLGNWISGYTYPTIRGAIRQKPLVTRVDESAGKVLPFTGIAEAYVLAALKAAGVPMTTIRPAVDQLKKEMKLEHVLLSERLKTDGVDVLIEYLIDEHKGFQPVRNLAAVVGGPDRQLVFREVVESYLQTITYGPSGVDWIQLPFYKERVVIDPLLNAGRPSLAAFGVALSELTSRASAGDSDIEIADDFEIPLAMVRSVLADAS